VIELGEVESVRAYLATADPEGTLLRCEIRDIRLGRGQIAHVAASVAALLQAPARVTMLVDRTPILRQGEDVKGMVEAQLRERFTVHKEVLDDGHAELHVDEAVIDIARRAVADADAVVTVGGGSITDIGKLATFRSGQAPLVVVQTAASVDGYTDNVSVTLRNGVKRTVESRWPDVIIADLETIREAPVAMNRAGYGEMNSMFTAPADWRLAALLELDPSFHRALPKLLEAAGSGIDVWSPGVGRGEMEAIERLTWALAVRGIATGIAGTTACLSGVEHLVSHMLDMYHAQRGLPIGLHGAQVGVASVIAAAAWELLFERMADSASDTRLGTYVPDPTVAKHDVEAAFADLDPSGRIGAECWHDYSGKLQTWADKQPVAERVLKTWAEHEPDLRALVRPSAEIGGALRAAGVACRFGELDPTISPDLARWAVSKCGLMRSRFTVVDLLTFLNWWGPDDIDWVMQRAEKVTAPGEELLTRGA
jgi:glycerol-1-phosphate dehydrogenase [NAD(P)+]